MDIKTAKNKFKTKIGRTGWRWLSLLVRCYNVDNNTNLSYQAALRAYMGINSPDLRKDLLDYATKTQAPKVNPMRRKSTPKAPVAIPNIKSQPQARKTA